MTTLFISDLHLEADRPDIGEQFAAFLDSEARDADALYILGDLFEYWVGDDDPNPYYAQMKRHIRRLADVGVPIYFMHGNRDFAIGESFADETGITLLDDPVAIELYGRTVLLSHGDALCTDDVEYQKARAMRTNPDWLAMMLAKPLAERIAFAEHTRQQSQLRSAPEEIMDVNGDAVKTLLARHNVDILLHGHTHRPAVHDVDVDGKRATRIVLGDWYDQGSVVRWNGTGPTLETLPRATRAS